MTRSQQTPFFILIQFAIFCFLNSFSAAACEKTISVSAGANWPPYSYYENEAYKGLDIEIVEHVLLKADFCWDYVVYPSSSRAFLEFKKGNVDLIFAASFVESRAEYASFSAPYRTEVMTLFTQPDNPKEIRLTNETTVAVNRGSYYGALFQRYIEDCQSCIVETNLVAERINLVRLNRVDFAIEELLSGLYLINKHGISDAVMETNVTINHNPVHFMLNPEVFNQQEVESLNQAIETSDEFIRELVEKYYAQSRS